MSLACPLSPVTYIRIERAMAENSRRRVAIGRCGALVSLIRHMAANWIACRQLSPAMWKGLPAVPLELVRVMSARLRFSLVWIFLVRSCWFACRFAIAGFYTRYIPSAPGTPLPSALLGREDIRHARGMRDTFSEVRCALVFLRSRLSPRNPGRTLNCVFKFGSDAVAGDAAQRCLQVLAMTTNHVVAGRWPAIEKNRRCFLDDDSARRDHRRYQK